MNKTRTSANAAMPAKNICTVSLLGTAFLL
jgi:hypothetical protein